MPKVEIDYSNTIIYKIICKDPLITDAYVGHTTNFVQRKYAHKQACNNIKSLCYNLKLYKTIRAHGNWANWEMTIVNFYNCKDHLEAKQKEQEHFVELNATLNSVEPLPSKASLLKPSCETATVSIPINVITEEKKNATANIDNNNFTCVSCYFKCSKQSDWDRHIARPKHAELQMIKIDTKKTPIINETFICDCGNIYKFKSGMYRHKKICAKVIKNANELANESVNDIVIKLINQNKELQQMLLDQNNKFFELAKDVKFTTNNTTGNNNNNTTNNTNNFNLQIFLNETCKDALNLSDFVSSLQVKLKDLEETAKIGYTEGVSKIFINGLNDLEVNMRPIHCSDLKRETLYIKNDDKWTKESSEKSNITKAIKKVSNKNIQQIFEWQKKYPEYNNSESKQNDRYQEMLFTAMGGSTDEEQLNNFDKIIRNITKEVVIDKTA